MGVMGRDKLTADLLLLDSETAQTVQVGHQNPFEDLEPNIHVRVSNPDQRAVETAFIRVAARPAPTVILEAATPLDPAEAPSGEVTGLMDDPRSGFSNTIFVVVLAAVSIASVAAGMLFAQL